MRWTILRPLGLISLALVSLFLVACAGSQAPSAASANVTAPSPIEAEPTDAPTPATSTATPTSTVEATLEPSPSASPSPVTNTPTSTASRTALPQPTGTPSPTAAPNKRTADKLVLAYYVPYDSTSWVSFTSQAEHIDYVAPQWVTIDACGNIGSRDDRTLISLARSRGIRILPSLLTSSGSLNHRLLTEERVAANAVNQIVAYVMREGYDGLDLDLEGVAATDRQALSAFVSRLSQALRAKRKLLTMAIPAKSSDTTTGWAGAYDYAALAPSIDLAVIMAYAYTTPSSRPGSTAPYSWVEKVASFATSQIPAEKVLLGLAFFGYDWNATTGSPARSLRYAQASELAARYGSPIVLDPGSRSATFSYTVKAGETEPQFEKIVAPSGHDISVKNPPPCDISTPAATPRPTEPPAPTATASPVPPLLQQHVVWLESADSVQQRLNLADTYRTKGIATWRLGQEDPAVWPLLQTWKQKGG